MAYFIFLKYLRSLEDFRKNPHVKNSSKISSYKFSKPFYIQKSNFYSEKNFSFTFGLIGPAASQPIWPFGPCSPPNLSSSSCTEARCRRRHQPCAAVQRHPGFTPPQVRCPELHAASRAHYPFSTLHSAE
jgi:hypothetical protein